MTEFKPGDKVRLVETEAYIVDRYNGDQYQVRPAGTDGGEDFTVSARGLALIERADDPARDPIGTVRKNTGSLGGVYIKQRRGNEIGWHSPEDFWDLGGGTLGPIVGAVPGTPAAEERHAEDNPTALPTAPFVSDGEGDVFKRESDGSYTLWYATQKRWGIPSNFTAQSLFDNHGPITVTDDPESPLWTGDGSEEPPAFVVAVRDRDGDVLRRIDGNLWTYGSAKTGWALRAWRSPFTEVRG